MGDSISHGFGFGFEISDATLNIYADLDIQDLIEDDYLLLSYNIAGYHWERSLVRPSLVTIKETTSKIMGYNTAKVDKLLSIPTDGMKQLLEFGDRFKIELTPSWFIWSYRG